MAKNSLTDLLAQKAALDQKIAQMQQAHRSDAISKVKAMMAEYGLTAADLGDLNQGNPGNQGSSGAGPENPFAAARRKAGGAKTAARGAGASAPAAPGNGKTRKPSANAGRKVAPKYRNPATGDTWSGRGLKPKWLVAALSSGRSLSEFAL